MNATTLKHKHLNGGMCAVTRAGRCLLTQAQETQGGEVLFILWTVVGGGERKAVWTVLAQLSTPHNIHGQTHLPEHGCRSSHGRLQEITLSVRAYEQKGHTSCGAVTAL